MLLVACQLEEVGADRVETVRAGGRVVLVEGAEQCQTGSWTVNVREGDGTAERDHRARRDVLQGVVEGQYLGPGSNYTSYDFEKKLEQSATTALRTRIPDPTRCPQRAP